MTEENKEKDTEKQEVANSQPSDSFKQTLDNGLTLLLKIVYVALVPLLIITFFSDYILPESILSDRKLTEAVIWKSASLFVKLSEIANMLFSLIVGIMVVTKIIGSNNGTPNSYKISIKSVGIRYGIFSIAAWVGYVLKAHAA